MNFGTSHLRKEPPACWIFQKGCIEKGDCSCAKFVMLQKRDVCENTWYKIMGISWSTLHELQVGKQKV
jgi:hypothetical protein